jgi:hypothetical protein
MQIMCIYIYVHNIIQLYILNYTHITYEYNMICVSSVCLFTSRSITTRTTVARTEAHEVRPHQQHLGVAEWKQPLQLSGKWGYQTRNFQWKKIG